MTKITRFQDIPQFTPPGQWECDYDLPYLIKFIVMTELVRACGDEQIDASERFAAAMEVFDEEAALA